MKHYILNIIGNTNAKIVISITAIGGILQIIAQKSQQFYPEFKKDENESELNTNNQCGKSRLKAGVNFLAENGLIGGLIVGTSSVIVKEIPFRSIVELVVITRPVPSIQPSDQKKLQKLMETAKLICKETKYIDQKFLK